MLTLLQSCLASAERVFELLDAPEIPPDSAMPAVSANGAGKLRGGTAHGGPWRESSMSRANPRTDAIPGRHNAPDRPPASHDLLNPGAVAGRVTFEHVSFSYSPGTPVVKDLSFTVEPGQTVAIVGHTGAGKTTVVNLLMRFYELDSGRILVDSTDIATIPRDELRRAFGIVLQDAWLFTGSIRENIEYGRPGATEADIVAAARASHVDQFVRSLPAGYATMLGNDGDSLSRGQRQLVSIARAQIAGRSIMVLERRRAPWTAGPRCRSGMRWSGCGKVTRAS